MATQPEQQVLFDKFQILQCWKKDAVSAVYLAYHIFLEIEIVLKTLDLRNTADPTMAERFKREARLLAKLDHPNIIKVLDFGTAAHFFYISFEYFPAQSLRWWLANRTLGLEERVGLFVQAAQALHVAHTNNVIHRDVKPENILVSDQLELKLADFGLAQFFDESRLTEQNAIVGTPGYLSPEQIHGESLTPGSDMFSLGIVGYELFAGHNPFLGPDIGSTINNILNKPESELFSEERIPQHQIREVLSGLLQRQPDMRLTSGEIMRLLLQQDESEATAPSQQQTMNSVSPRMLWQWGIVVIVLIVVVIINTQIPSGSRKKAIQKSSQDTTVVLAPSPKIEPRAEKADGKPPAPDSSQAASQSMKTPIGYGLLYVDCRPWAEVHIDNKKIDTTPLHGPLRLYAGTHELALLHPDYPAWHQTVTLASEQTATVNVCLDTLFGFFQPLIHPWGELYIDDVAKGITPLAKPVALEPGRHSLGIVNKQYGRWRELVQIKAGDTLRYSLDFNKVVAEPL